MQITNSATQTAPSSALLPGAASPQQQAAGVTAAPNKPQQKQGPKGTDFSDAMMMAGAVASAMPPVIQQPLTPALSAAGMAASQNMGTATGVANAVQNATSGGADTPAAAAAVKMSPAVANPPVSAYGAKTIPAGATALPAQVTGVQSQSASQILGLANPKAAQKNGLSSGQMSEESWEVVSATPGQTALSGAATGAGVTAGSVAQKGAQAWSSEDYVQTMNTAKKPVTIAGKKAGVNAVAVNGAGTNPVTAETASAAKSALPASLAAQPSAVSWGSDPNSLQQNIRPPVQQLDQQNSQMAAAQAAAGGALAKGINSNLGTAPQSGATQLTGHVVPGSSSKARLSSESVSGMSNQIRSFSEQQGGGEIRVKLKPDNLGELSVRVVTRGGQVGLEIRASDENAKKVIEESIDALKESLSTQNLNLARLDVAVGQVHSAEAGAQTSNQDLNQNQSSQLNQQQYLFGDQSSSGGRNDADPREATQFGNSIRDGERMRTSAQAPLTTRYQRQMTSDGRLNVLA